MSLKTPIPPKWPDRFLSWYCNDKVREQVQGDAYELFYWRLEDKGLSGARRAFMWDVLRLFKWSNIKRTNHQKLNSIAMFKNYFKIGLRNLWKQKMPSTINIIGLSLAVGCCLVSFKWIESKLIKDSFHDRAEDIYLVTPTRIIEDNLTRYGITTVDVANKIEQKVPGVEMLVRYINRSSRVKIGEAEFDQYYSFADPEFFDLFSFEFLSGSREVLNDPRSLILGESQAKAYFGDADPMGKALSIKMEDEERFFKVGAIVKDAPDNSSLRIGMFIGFSVYEQDVDFITGNTHAFLLLSKSVDREIVAGSLAEIANEKESITPKTPYKDIRLEPLLTMAKNSREIDYGLGGTPPMAPMIVLSCIGGFMLLLSTFNYVNISTVMAMKRVKEIGVRKVIGSRRSQLIAQFLTENLILCLLAIVLGCLIASAFFLPWFNEIAGGNLKLDLLHHRNLWKFLVALLVFITVASGLYPSFYVSSFRPTVIFRGQGSRGGKRRLTGGLLAFQMTLAVITIVAGVMFVRTNIENESRDWGYDQFDKLVVSVPREMTFNRLKTELSKNPNVETVAGSQGIIGNNYRHMNLTLGEKKISVNTIQADPNYPEIMGLKLKEGTFFGNTSGNRNGRSLIVNETFMERMGISLADGDLLTSDSITYVVAGVVEDYHYSSFSDVIRPAAFRVSPDSLLTNLTVKVRAGTALQVQEDFEATLKELAPDSNHTVFAQDTIFDGHFEEMNGIRNIMLFTATLCVLLAAMGLFGLVSLNISSRQKDFSIKKVLGANLRQLSTDIYKRFMTVLGIAILLGGTISVFLIGMLLDSVYGYHESIGVIPLALAGTILLTVAALTINTQVRNVKRMNPAETLRAE